MKRVLNKSKIGLIALAYSFITMQSAIADDTEVFFGGTVSTASGNPNILFVFDTSGSMSRSQSYTVIDNGVPVTVNQSRIGILQDVMSEIMSEQTGVNMGLSRFSVPGGPILYPVTDPDETADPIILRSLSSEASDAVQVGTKVTLDDSYLNPGGVDDIIGLRYENVAVPQGALITAANLVFSTDVDSFDPAEYLIYAEVVPNAAPFEEAVKNLSNRVSGFSMYWNADPWDAEPILSSEDPPTSFESPDISAVLQPVINQKGVDINDPAGWCGGNDLVILLVKKSATGRTILSHDKSQDFSPKLRIDFNPIIPPGQNGCYANTVYSTVNNSRHDSESGTGNYWSGDLDFRYDTYYKENNASIALSFEDVRVPQGSSIIDARLNFVSSKTSSGSADITIHAVNSATPAKDITLHSLPLSSLTSGIYWDIPSWDFGVQYASENIATIVQNVVGLGGWASGNDMSFVLRDGAGRRAAYSFDGSQSRAAQLEVTFRGAFIPSAATKRAAMIAAIEDFKATGNTPISDTIAEAGLYYKGENALYGLQRGSPTKRDNRISHIDTMVGGSGVISTPVGCSENNMSATACKDESWLGGPQYQTPIKDSCQANHIVLLTDGAPTSHDRDTNALYARWTKEITGTAGSCATNDSGKDCTIKMAGLFKNNDVLPGTSDTETITTHTIGFYSDQTFLQDVADAGGGKYVTAFSKQELIDAISEIVNSILDVNTTFVSAGVTVNQYNRLTHNDELYFSLFSPSDKTVWPGNLKRYRLTGGELVDANGSEAVNASGKFNDTAQSWWSDVVDGDEVELGGAAEKMSNSRLVYSNITGDSNVNLAAGSNIVKPSNTSVTEAMISAADSSDRDTILRWVVGEDVNNVNEPTSARKKMGDPLHSQPTLLIYATGADSFRTSVYVGTNEGFLHSFDTESGKENWSFIPKNLMTRLSEVQKETNGKHTYGLDGSVTLFIDEVPGSGTPGVVDSGEKAYLYIGMRRGGSEYYALDVTNPDKPQLMFIIDDNLLGTSGKHGLGQTWSQPVVKKTKIPGHETVLMFGGGYAPIQDTQGTAPQADDKGVNVFMINAVTGEYIWDAQKASAKSASINTVDASTVGSAGSLTTMNAIPDQITAFDIDGDLYIDHFYAADTKSQVFRFDVDYDTGTITGGRIAHLQGVADASNNRRFYNTPDVSLVRLSSGSFLSVAIGSGYRAHPLDDTITDHFYVLKDSGALSKEFDMDATIDQLADVTYLIGDTDNDGASDASEVINDPMNPKKGWYITFSNRGEKIITSSVTFNNVVLFTSYTPPGAAGSTCDAIAGTSRIYGLRVTDGNPYIDTNYDGQLTETDRYAELATSGIAPEPQIVLTDNGPVVCVGGLCGTSKIAIYPPPPPEGVMGVRWRRN